MSHTPRPLKAEHRGEEWGLWGPNGERVLSIRSGVIPTNADAHVLAAAPELLEALESAAIALREAADFLPSDSDADAVCAAALRIIHTTIRKARGEG